MQSRAILRNIRIAPRKIRLIADLVRGKNVRDAEAVLRMTIKRGAEPLLKLLKAAVSQAKNRFEVQENQLYIQTLTVDEGSKLKRWRARSRGRAYAIQKKTSHITLVLGARGDLKQKELPKKVEAVLEEAHVEKEQKEEGAKKPILRQIAKQEKPQTEQGVIRRIFRRKSV